MPEIKITSLAITGHGHRSLPNRLFRQDTGNYLAVIVPGLRYTCDMPLLYYTTRLLIQAGADVLQLLTDYTQADFENASRQEQALWLGSDAMAALTVARAHREYQRVCLAGKSIGTIALAFLAASGAIPGATTLWFTPLLHQPLLVQAAMQLSGPSLFLVGSGDATYDRQSMQRICDATGARVLELEAANHSLEVPADVLRSIAYHEQIMSQVADVVA